MDESMLMGVASAVASGTVAGLTDAGGAAALRNLLRWVTARLDRDPSSRAVLDAARHGPSDEALSALARELQSAAADELFASETRRLWQQVQQGLAASNGGVANTASVSGQVHGPVIQTRNVTGGISVGSPIPDRPENR